MAPIVTDQLEAALSLTPAPTLITLNGGGNDMLRPGIDVTDLVVLTERAVRRCAASGVRLVLLSGADPSDRLPFGRRIHRRAAALTAGVAALAAAHGVEFVDVFHDAEIRRPEYWSADRLHLNGTGHQRVAELVLEALGEGPAARAASSGSPAARRMLAEARYYREHVLPWIHRRLRGRSSGDDRTGKYLDWIPVPAVD
jgi:lysophospholipase L1-like esterase